MFVAERKDKILQFLKENERLTVKELASEIGVSGATLRSDLNQMESEGLLTRTHGGAVINGNIALDTSFSTRSKRNHKEKKLLQIKLWI